MFPQDRRISGNEAPQDFGVAFVQALLHSTAEARCQLARGQYAECDETCEDLLSRLSVAHRAMYKKRGIVHAMQWEEFVVFAAVMKIVVAELAGLALLRSVSGFGAGDTETGHTEKAEKAGDLAGRLTTAASMIQGARAKLKLDVPGAFWTQEAFSLFVPSTTVLVAKARVAAACLAAAQTEFYFLMDDPTRQVVLEETIKVFDSAEEGIRALKALPDCSARMSFSPVLARSRETEAASHLLLVCAVTYMLRLVCRVCVRLASCGLRSSPCLPASLTRPSCFNTRLTRSTRCAQASM